MYDGWLTVAGVEIVNRARSIAYKDALLPALVMADCTDCYDLRAAIGDEDPYTTPAADEAPWYDPDTPASGEFLGLVPISMMGFEDSTRTARVTESTLDGGTVGRTRKATREMRVSGMLVGASQAATSAGLSWLKAVLDGNLCNTCDDSDDICFFAACPRVDEDPDDFIRHLRRVKCVAGPTVISERALSCGGYAVTIEFTLVAGSPYVYGEPVMVASATGSSLTPIFPGSEVFEMDAPLDQCFAALDKAKLNTILKDPDCPPLPNPPTVPVLTSACKPLQFATFQYPPTGQIVTVRKNNYESRPVVAYGAGVWLTAYTHNPSFRGIDASTVIRARTSTTSGSTWGTEYTLYDEGSGTRGVEPAGITYAPDIGKFIMGVNNWNFAVPSKTLGSFKGEILTSTTGLSGSWSVIANLDAPMAAWGAVWYYLSDVEHREDGSANGVTYAAVEAGKNDGLKSWVVLLRSFDGGVTWSVFSTPYGNSTTSNSAYPHIALWPNGEMGVLANLVDRKMIGWRRSADGGRTWTPLVAAATAGSGIPAPVVTEDGIVLFMYADMRDPGPRNMGHHNYKYSRDRGRTWYPGTTAFTNNNPNGQRGADWAVGPDGHLGAAFAVDYSNTRADVYWTRFTQVANYLSYAIGVPDSALKAWADGVMLLQIRTGAKETRQMRVRLIPRPIDTLEPVDLDPCSVCSSFIIDYAPANTVIYLDGMTQRVTMKVANGTPSPADHLVSGENGAIFEWPLFTCGTGYFVLIDVDVATIVDVALAVANRE